MMRSILVVRVERGSGEGAGEKPNAMTHERPSCYQAMLFFDSAILEYTKVCIAYLQSIEDNSSAKKSETDIRLVSQAC
jgi:hypothetical protein